MFDRKSWIRSVLESASTKLESFPAWRTLLAAFLLVTTLGLLLLSYQGTRREMDYDTTISGRSTVVDLNQEATIARNSGFHVPEDTLQKKIARSYCSTKECKAVKCSFIPAGFDPGKVASNYIDTDFKGKCTMTRSIKLSFKDCKFPSNVLHKDWFHTDVPIEELILDSCSLNEIKDGAFSLTVYQETRKMSIINNNIQTLNKAMFRHLLKLQELTIRENTIKQAEFNLLEHAAGTLETLQLDSVIDNAEILRNITGGSTLLKVQILSIRGNSISTIDPGIFAGVPEVRSLYIDKSDVKTVLPETFQPMANSLALLFLNDNGISSLPDGLFDTVLHFNPQFRMAIDNNPWHCDCRLKWMQELLEYFPSMVITIPTCKTPKNNALLSFKKATFCDKSEYESTTVESNSEKTEESSVTTIGTDTTGSTGSTCSRVSTFLKQPRNVLLSTLDFRHPPLFTNFTVIEIGDGGLLVNLPNLEADVFLLWFVRNDFEETRHCVKVRHSYMLPSRPQTTYTICVFDEENLASTLTCLSLTTSSSYEDETWLTNADKTVVISFLCVSFVLLPLVTALVVFVFIRKHPTLLRGSKRVLLVKRRNVDAIVLPKGVQINEHSNKGNGPTVSSKPNEDGYVTPLPPIRRGSRISRTSMQSDGHSYVSGVEPTMMQLASWRLKRLKNELANRERELPPIPPLPRRGGTIPSLSLMLDSKEVEPLDYSSRTV